MIINRERERAETAFGLVGVMLQRKNPQATIYRKQLKILIKKYRNGNWAHHVREPKE